MMSKLTTGPYSLIAVLLLATLLRVWGLTWGLPSATHYFSYHPDESRVLQVAMFSMNLFAGKLLPHFYNYGSLQLYLVNFANSLAFLFGGVDIVPKDFAVWYPQWARMYLIGRCLTVATGVGTVWATYALGHRLWGRRAGLLAALILAIMPLHAQHSHWLTVDVPATFWGVLSLLWTMRLATGDAPRPFRAVLWAGVFAGLAAATKYNMALVLVPLAAACLLAPPPSAVSGAGGASSRLKPLTIGLSASVVAFLLACPGAVVESKQFLADLRFEAVHVNNAEDPTFKDTGSGFVFHITHNLDPGLGLPLLLLALGSVAYALYRRERGDGLLTAFALPYYIVISLAAVRYARYVIPLLPMLALWCGRLLADLSRLRQPLLRGATLTIGAFVLLLTLAYCLWIVQPMAGTDPRDRANEWLRAQGVTETTGTTAFAALPWFQAPPLDPYFTLPAPGAGWRQYRHRLMSVDGNPSLLYEGADWDDDLLQRLRPSTVILSEYDYRDALRLHDPRLARFMTVLLRDYRVAFVTPAGVPSSDGGYGLPLHNLPHDMLYTNPAIVIYQRRP